MPSIVVTDIVQLTREAIVGVLDTHADIVAITGRSDTNIVPFDEAVEFERPLLAYQFIAGPELAADGDTYELLFQISAAAPTDAEANELLAVVVRELDQPAFLTLPSPLDAFVTRRIRRGLDLDVTLRVSLPLAAAA